MMGYVENHIRSISLTLSVRVLASASSFIRLLSIGAATATELMSAIAIEMMQEVFMAASVMNEGRFKVIQSEQSLKWCGGEVVGKDASRNDSKELTRNLKNEQSLKGCGCEVVGRYCCYPKNTDEKPIDIEDSQ